MKYICKNAILVLLYFIIISLGGISYAWDTVYSVSTASNGHTLLSVTNTFGNPCEVGWGGPTISNNMISITIGQGFSGACVQVVTTGTHQFDLGNLQAGTYSIQAIGGVPYTYSFTVNTSNNTGSGTSGGNNSGTTAVPIMEGWWLIPGGVAAFGLISRRRKQQRFEK